MRAPSFLLLIATLACGRALATIPEVLVVQSTKIVIRPSDPKLAAANAAAARNEAAAKKAKVSVPEADQTDRPVPVDVVDSLAQELYNDGRVSPIVWSMGDPIFRAAVYDGTIKSPPDNPTFEQAQAVQKKLKIEMLLVISAFQNGDQLEASAELYRGGKVIWKDDKSMSTLLDGRFDRNAAANSLGRTWTQIMGQGVLHGFTRTPPQPTPDPEPGPAPKTPDVVPPAAPKTTDDKKIFADADDLFGKGLQSQAIGVLRDAIDAAPDDMERRQALITMLVKANKPDLAAAEARRASELAPNDLRFHLLAAKAWLAAGQPDEAQKDLNEIVARDPKGSGAREMLGEAALWQLNAKAAIDHFDAAIKDDPTPEAHLYRAMAKAVSGDLPGVSADLDGLTGLDPHAQESRYAFCTMIVDKAANQIADESKPLFQAALAKPTKDIGDGVAYQARRVNGLVEILQKLDPGKLHQKSHDRRILALKLLAQSLSDLGGYLNAPDEDALTDARINLGEAIKQLDAAGEVYRAESKGSSDSGRVD